MNNTLKSELESIEECKYCSQSSILMSSSKSSNIQNKEYFLYFQNNNLSLFECDDVGMVVLDEVKIGYCPMCGRELGISGCGLV